MNKYSVSPKMPRSGAPAIFMNSVHWVPIFQKVVPFNSQAVARATKAASESEKKNRYKSQ